MGIFWKLRNQKGRDTVRILKKSYEHATIRICLDDIENNVLKGSIHTPFLKQGIDFSDVSRFLNSLENVAEHRGFPEPVFRMRDFSVAKDKLKIQKRKEEMPIVRSVEEIEQQFGKSETIRLFITSRRNAGLQGHFVVLSAGSIVKFSSELELLEKIEHLLTTEHQDINREKVME